LKRIWAGLRQRKKRTRQRIGRGIRHSIPVLVNLS
jgi:hypothetical protein